MPACPKCGHQVFALTEIEPMNSRYKMFAVNCASIACQAVVGVTEYFDLGTVSRKLEAKIEEVEKRLSRIEQALR
jgi:hypothetical protein